MTKAPLDVVLDRIWTELVQLELDMALIHKHLGITRPVDTEVAREVLQRIDRFLDNPAEGVLLDRPPRRTPHQRDDEADAANV